MSETEIKKNVNVFSWFRNMWLTNPAFSTGMALIVMIILQTLALGFNFDSVGTWFSTWLQNWINILRNNAGIGIIALGMTFVIISGGIDLAVGSTLVAIGAVLMMLIDTWVPWAFCREWGSLVLALTFLQSSSASSSASFWERLPVCWSRVENSPRSSQHWAR